MEQNRPIKVYKIGVLTLNLWENVTKEGKFSSFTIDRIYKDREDKWQRTKSLRLSDLLKLKVLVDEAYRDLVLNEKEFN